MSFFDEVRDLTVSAQNYEQALNAHIEHEQALNARIENWLTYIRECAANGEVTAMCETRGWAKDWVGFAQKLAAQGFVVGAIGGDHMAIVSWAQPK